MDSDKKRKTVRENVNESLLKTINMSYDEFEELSFDEQQSILRDYHKKHPNKDKKVTIMVGGGDSPIFMSVDKGSKVVTPNGYYIAGETLEENKKRWENEFSSSSKAIEKLNKIVGRKITKLDIKTNLFLYLTKAVKVEHIPVIKINRKIPFEASSCRKDEVYVFRNYEEYRNFFLMYLDDVPNDLIDLGIYTRGKKGQIVALKGLCEQIIVKVKNSETSIDDTSKKLILTDDKK